MTQWQPSTLQANQEFWVTTGKLVTLTNANLQMGFCLFNPANSGKVAYVHDLQVLSNNQSVLPINKITADLNLGLNLVPQNMIAGSAAASSMIVDSTPNSATAGVSASGTLFMESSYGVNTVNELLENAEDIELLPGNGIALFPFVTTAGNYWIVNAGWTERPLSAGA